MPNSFAYLMLLLWPLVTLVLFRRLPVAPAVIWSILGGYLLLPPVAAFSLPVLPDMDKVLIPNLAAFLACTLMLHHRVPLLPEFWPGRALMLVFLFSPIATILANDAPLAAGPVILPGLRAVDVVSTTLGQVMLILPLALGRRYLASGPAQRALLVALMTGGLIYALPMLLEVRLSPQINVWVYGFFQHSFEQMMRFGGFRPIVFLPHGLWAAFFAMLTVVATLALWRRARGTARQWYFWVAVGLAGVLILCKTFGPVIYAILLIPLLAFAENRRQIRLAALVALLVVAYPVLREADLVPVDRLIARIEPVNHERAQSLAFRFANEDLLIAHAKAQPLLGWGGWGRNMIYEPTTGAEISVSDGRWVVVLGIFGGLGFLGEFGLLALPLLLLAWEVRRIDPAQIPLFAGPLALMLAANLVDLLPNATLIPLTWLLAGSLLGQAEDLRRHNRAQAAARLEAADLAASGSAATREPTGPRTIL